jgi:hypothetical protein
VTEIVRLLANILRLMLDFIILILRTLNWGLEGLCMGLEWASRQFVRDKTEPAQKPEPVVTRPRLQSPRLAVVQKPEIVDEEEERIQKMMVFLGDNKKKDPVIRERAIAILNRPGVEFRRES